MIQRSAKVGALCGTVLLAGWSVAWLTGTGSTVVDNAGVATQSRVVASLTADTELADPTQATAIGNTAVLSEDVATACETDIAVVPETETAAITDPETVAATGPELETAIATTSAPDEPKLAIEVALLDQLQIPESESPPVQMATAGFDSLSTEAKSPVRTIEIHEECLVVDICIDRFLWALYERTPKEDTVKVHERRKVAVKRKGKMVTVTKTFTRLVNENFAWKDPKAAERFGMEMMDYVIGGMDRSFKTKLFHTLYAAEQAGLSPGITSAFRDDYRQSIATGMKAATDRSFHGGSFRGGYGHGLAADVVSVNGTTRAQRWVATETFWKWIDQHGKEFGIGRPYLGRDPPHVGPVDGREYAAHQGGMKAAHAALDVKKPTRLALRDERAVAKAPKKRKVVQTGAPARLTRQGAVSSRPTLAMVEPGRG